MGSRSLSQFEDSCFVIQFRVIRGSKMCGVVFYRNDLNSGVLTQLFEILTCILITIQNSFFLSYIILYHVEEDNFKTIEQTFIFLAVNIVELILLIQTATSNTIHYLDFLNGKRRAFDKLGNRPSEQHVPPEDIREWDARFSSLKESLRGSDNSGLYCCFKVDVVLIVIAICGLIAILVTMFRYPSEAWISFSALFALITAGYLYAAIRIAYAAGSTFFNAQNSRFPLNPQKWFQPDYSFSPV